jgi:hypothetical protein
VAKEVWKEIGKEFPGYEVSDRGRVRSNRGRDGEWRVLKDGEHSKGYRTVVLSYAYDGVQKRQTSRLVHRLVLEAFVGLRPPGMQARHLDGDRANNKLSNLCWGTQEEAEQDKVRNDTVLLGEKNHKTKLTEKEVKAIKRKMAHGATTSQISEEYGIATPSVSDIRYGVSWGHVPWPKGFEPVFQSRKVPVKVLEDDAGYQWKRSHVRDVAKKCDDCRIVIKPGELAYRPLPNGQERLCVACAEARMKESVA